MRSARSNTTTEWPARVSCCAAASPAGPEPTTATFRPVRTDGTTGSIQPFAPGALDDLDLDLLDGDRVLADAEHARGLARRRAQPPGELGEVVGGVQPLDRVAPVVAVDEVVPVGDEVAERAAVVAERDAAVHAAPGLDLQGLLGERLVDLAPVAQAHRHRPAGRRLAPPLHEPRGLTHAPPHHGGRHHLQVGLLRRQPELLGLRQHPEHAAVVLRHHLAERLDLALPLVEQPLGHLRAGGSPCAARRWRAATRGRRRRAARARRARS